MIAQRILVHHTHRGMSPSTTRSRQTGDASSQKLIYRWIGGSGKSRTHGRLSDRACEMSAYCARPSRESKSHSETKGHSSQFKNNCMAEMWSGSEEGSCLRLLDCCITQL